MFATLVLATSLANITAVDVRTAGIEKPALVQVAQGFGQGSISSGGKKEKKGRRRLFGAELESRPVNKANKAGSATGSNPQNHLTPGTGSFTSPGFRVPNKRGNNAINDKALQEINQPPSKQ